MFRTQPSGSAGSEPPGTKVYGPVPSRRLGRSLGVDLVPFKTCTYDCVYCQLGRTTRKTLERRAFCRVGEVIDEVRDRLAASHPDYITVAGSGEPTLEINLGEVLEGLKGLSDTPVALLTNGSLLWDEEVQRAAALADVVMPSLDAGDEDLFLRINRPVEGLSLSKVLHGLEGFRDRFAGPIWLEVMVLAGKTDARDRLDAIADAAARIRPDCIQLNTPVRPGGAGSARAVDRDRLLGLRSRFVPHAEVIADFAPSPERDASDLEESADTVLALLRRRPCTINEIAVGLDIRCKTVRIVLGRLQNGKTVHCFRKEGRLYYAAVAGANRGRWE